MVIYLYCFLTMTFALSAMQEPKKSLHPVIYRANPKFFIQSYMRTDSLATLEKFLEKEEVVNELQEDKVWILNKTKNPKIIAIFLKKGVLTSSDIFKYVSNSKKFSVYEIESYKTLMKPSHVKKYEKKQEQKKLTKYLNSHEEIGDFLWKVNECTDQTLVEYLKDKSIINFIQKEEYLFPLALRQTQDPLKLKVLVDHGINLNYEYTTPLLHAIADKPWLYHYDFLYAVMARYIREKLLTSPKKVALGLRYTLDQEQLSAFEVATQTYKICQKKTYEKGKISMRIATYLAKKDPQYYRAFKQCLEESYKEIKMHNIMKIKYENNSTYLDYQCIYPWRKRKKALNLLNPAIWEGNQQLFEEIQRYQKEDK